VENVKVVDPYNLKEMTETIKEFLNKDKVSVIVAKRECRLLTTRKMKKQGMKIPKFEIDQSKCNRCGKCLYEFGCPAIMKKEDGSFYIDKSLCLGCAVCPQVCPVKAIGASK
jgi:indolepyruvate ferredoxin oxidoreductase alpha subunit